MNTLTTKNGHLQEITNYGLVKDIDEKKGTLNKNGKPRKKWGTNRTEKPVKPAKKAKKAKKVKAAPRFVVATYFDDTISTDMQLMEFEGGETDKEVATELEKFFAENPAVKKIFLMVSVRMYERPVMKSTPIKS